MKTYSVILPNGFIINGRRYQNAELRVPNGKDEIFIKELFPGISAVKHIIFLLSRCLVELGPKKVVQDDDIRSLTLGDHDALLLHLRRITYGGKIASVLVCPKAGCEEKMSLELNIEDILIPPKQHTREFYELNKKVNGDNYSIEFRLPTVGDLEAVTDSFTENSESSSMKLLYRCIRDVKKNGRKLISENLLPETVADTISRRMAQLDPQSEILLNMTCPVCGNEFMANFDIGNFFLKELAAHSQDVFHEVHLLAWNYHWDEGDILDMTRARRQIYLNMLAEVLNTDES